MSKRSTTTGHSIEDLEVNMELGTQTSQQSPARGGRVLLIASLAINALFVGGLMSALVRHGAGPHGPPNGNNGPNGLGAYVATLPAERGRVIAGRTNERRQAMGPLRREVRQARDDAIATLSIDPFDKDKFLAAQKRLIELENRQRLGQLEILADIAAAMTSDERQAYLRWRTGQTHGPATSIAVTPPPK